MGLLVEESCSGELQCGTWPYDHLVYKTVFFRPKIICNLSFSRFVANEHLSPRYSYVTLVSGYRFDSCQLTITRMSIRMSTIKLNTDCICLGNLASNAWSLQDNLAHLAASQSERAIVAI